MEILYYWNGKDSKVKNLSDESKYDDPTSLHLVLHPNSKPNVQDEILFKLVATRRQYQICNQTFLTQRRESCEIAISNATSEPNSLERALQEFSGPAKTTKY